jgi:hypothetical protein
VVERIVVPNTRSPPARKLPPVAVREKAELPDATDAGASDVRVGTGFGLPTVTETLDALKPPPGGGL